MASRPLRSDPAAVVALLSGPGRSDFAQFLARQRWFAAKTRGVGTLAVRDWAILDAEGPLVLLLLDVDGDRYHVPVTVAADAPAGAALARLDGESVVDAHDDPRFGRRVLAAIAAGRRLAGQAGRVSFHPTPGWSFPPDPDAVPARRHPGEQSNTSVMLGTGLVLKTLRRPQPGLNPDLEITRFLTTRTRFRHVPRLAGWSEYEGPEGTATLAVLQEFVVNGGDGWKHVVGALRARVAAGSLVGAPDPARDPLIADVRRLGAITGGLHAALASDGSDPDFAPEPVTREDVTRWAAARCGWGRKGVNDSAGARPVEGALRCPYGAIRPCRSGARPRSSRPHRRPSRPGTPAHRGTPADCPRCGWSAAPAGLRPPCATPRAAAAAPRR